MHFNDLPLEIILEIFSKLDLYNVLPLSLVCSFWRNIIGNNYRNKQFGCDWFHCWKRISNPKCIITKQYPKTSYSIYDSKNDILLLFWYKKKNNNISYKISTIYKPEGSIISCLLPYIIETINEPKYTDIIEYKDIKGQIIDHIILKQSNTIILIDSFGYLYHIQYIPKFSIISSNQSYSNGELIRSYALCYYSILNSEYLFICGGLLGSKKQLSNIWKIYNCSLNEFISNGELKYSRFYHSCTETGDGKILISGGKNSTKMFLSNSILSSVELFDISRKSIELLQMNHPRNLHQSFLLSNGDIMILGGNIDCSVEKFNLYSKEFIDLPYHISLNWQSLIAPVKDKFAIERAKARYIEIIDVYTPPTLFASHSLHTSLVSNQFRSFSSQGNTLIVLQNTEKYTCFHKIPFDDLRIMYPRPTEVIIMRNRSFGTKIDGYLYFLDDRFNILKEISISVIYPEELSKSLIELAEKTKCKYLQLHLLSNISRKNRSRLISLITSQCPSLILYLGLDFNE